MVPMDTTFNCEHCDLRLTCKESLNCHLEKCLNKERKLLAHIKVHEDQMPDKMELVSDSTKNNGNTIYECRACKIVCSDRDMFIQHIRYKHRSIRFIRKCEYCKKEYKKKSLFEAHILIHQDNYLKNLQCPYCPKKVIWPHNLKIHILKRHLKNDELVSNLIKDDFNLNKLQFYKCTVCPETFEENIELLLHLRNSHKLEVDIYKCCCCNAAFNLKDRLQLHLKEHQLSVSEEHKCEQCYPSACPKPYFETDTAFSKTDKNDMEKEVIDFDLTIMEDSDLRRLIQDRIKHLNTIKIQPYHNRSAITNKCKDLSDTISQDSQPSLEESEVFDNANLSCCNGHEIMDSPAIVQITSDIDALNKVTQIIRSPKRKKNKLFCKVSTKKHSRTYTCDYCQSSFQMLYSLSAHIQDEHGQIDLKNSANSVMTAQKSDSNMVMSLNDVPVKTTTKSPITKELKVSVVRIQPEQLISSDCPKSQYKCSECNWSFQLQKSLLQHMKHSHSSLQLYECLNCFTFFKDELQLQQHYEEEHVNKDLKSISKNKCFENKILHEKNPLKITESHLVQNYFNQNLSATQTDISPKTYENPNLIYDVAHDKINTVIRSPGKLKEYSDNSRLKVNLTKLVLDTDDIENTTAKINTTRFSLASTKSEAKKVPNICSTEPSQNTNFYPLLEKSKFVNLPHTKSQMVNKRTSKHKCKKCHLFFSTIPKLELHIRCDHNSKKRKGKPSKLKCIKCGLSFVLPHELASHVRVKHKRKKKFTTPRKRKPSKNIDLEELSYSEGNFVCTETRTSSTVKFSPLKERNNVEPKQKLITEKSTSNGRINTKKYECGKCVMFFQSKLELLRHISDKHMPLPSNTEGISPADLVIKNIVYCHFCSDSFLSKNLLIDHLEAKHSSSRVHNCFTCSLKFDSKADFTQHLRSEHRHRWGICSLNFVHKHKLLFHMKTHSKSPTQHKCTKCNVTFRLEASLAKHIDRKHQNAFNYDCKVCKRKFKHRNLLSSHMKTHDDSQKYKTLKINKVKVTTEIETSMHKCDKCCALFPLRDSLQRHIQWEHTLDLTLHKCGQCSSVFNDVEELKEHLQIEHLGVLTV